MTEKLTVAEELELFAVSYHNMILLDIDRSVIDDFVENFADQFEFDEDETEEPTLEYSDKPYRVYMKGTNQQWGRGSNYEFDTKEEAINEILKTYRNSPFGLQQSTIPFALNYWANTYEIRKETPTPEPKQVYRIHTVAAGLWSEKEFDYFTEAVNYLCSWYPENYVNGVSKSTLSPKFWGKRFAIRKEASKK